MSTLYITSSANPGASTSDTLGRETAEKLGGPVVVRDTNKGLIPIDQSWIAANFTPADDRSAVQRNRLALSDTLIAEVEAADTLVIAAPVYNFGVPSTLKAWIDHICRAGLTFKYTPDGPVGLLQGKRAIIVLASGGTKVGSDIDFASGYLRHIMGFIGITDVEIIAADRIMAEGDQAVSDARAKIAAL
ncbi:FMN-dependent NADH-azoreductase [Sulfitobacter sp. S190]|uniref:FMN-dependent NADH-azoreductase n=1 Tax=Sulfitobacter sp. S190 TaxID=2867022 RepID=UPI0021A92EE9|nr:NAD(P)H-dependent oxidoreductase [Sulfitobacter sp. S190]UWR22865.1 NAD(P)H-dependent oxidoreductase [Sulfitobacter sp. S190]